MLCKSCSAPIIQSYKGKTKLRSRILVFEQGKCLAKCKECGFDQPVPVALEKSFDDERPVQVVIVTKVRKPKSD